MQRCLSVILALSLVVSAAATSRLAECTREDFVHDTSKWPEHFTKNQCLLSSEIQTHYLTVFHGQNLTLCPSFTADTVVYYTLLSTDPVDNFKPLAKLDLVSMFGLAFRSGVIMLDSGCVTLVQPTRYAYTGSVVVGRKSRAFRGDYEMLDRYVLSFRDLNSAARPALPPAAEKPKPRVVLSNITCHANRSCILPLNQTQPSLMWFDANFSPIVARNNGSVQYYQSFQKFELLSSGSLHLKQPTGGLYRAFDGEVSQHVFNVTVIATARARRSLSTDVIRQCLWKRQHQPLQLLFNRTSVDKIFSIWIGGELVMEWRPRARLAQIWGEGSSHVLAVRHFNTDYKFYISGTKVTLLAVNPKPYLSNIYNFKESGRVSQSYRLYVGEFTPTPLRKTKADTVRVIATLGGETTLPFAAGVHAKVSWGYNGSFPAPCLLNATCFLNPWQSLVINCTKPYHAGNYSVRLEEQGYKTETHFIVSVRAPPALKLTDIGVNVTKVPATLFETALIPLQGPKHWNTVDWYKFVTPFTLLKLTHATEFWTEQFYPLYWEGLHSGSLLITSVSPKTLGWYLGVATPRSNTTQRYTRFFLAHVFLPSWAQPSLEAYEEIAANNSVVPQQLLGTNYFKAVEGLRHKRYPNKTEEVTAYSMYKQYTDLKYRPICKNKPNSTCLEFLCPGRYILLGCPPKGTHCRVAAYDTAPPQRAPLRKLLAWYGSGDGVQEDEEVEMSGFQQYDITPAPPLLPRHHPMVTVYEQYKLFLVLFVASFCALIAVTVLFFVSKRSECQARGDYAALKDPQSIYTKTM